MRSKTTGRPTGKHPTGSDCQSEVGSGAGRERPAARIAGGRRHAPGGPDLKCRGELGRSFPVLEENHERYVVRNQ